ncbi:pyruvate dehydrogenase E1 component subunit alpha [Sphingobium sp. TA15]|uniref:Pyruvate dehydrogenase n=7 Tax=Sphingomonadaceae TaxID=41297 RepID=A0A2S8B0C8_9SPHN|nr:MULTISPECIES: thiamine pyrophosphate-dependent dehydrogenase E1 component subunit alpha [Sphingomonadaceae]MBY2930860.1 thiamine pyrophosphate-dependent dehydrogenase E1 component subunit alpha [Sphingomonadales bacterium 56]MBY2960941.1 thiamine pyrophosphate-dependent dehydrogenase E1 component subunit alpha [Sphingomonadales bacterium 58]PQM25807.1 pyruvate dehydrogenase [Sphingopyxis lindanitolerans]CAD7342197.1 Acetoin:2,6-dichlorophenolindophenol oxidoreductase subunit alpha [Sphingobi
MNGPDLQRSLRLFERMLLIRRMEERLGDLGKAGELPGNVHLYIGQEAVATGVCAHLDDSDWVASTHRGHGHFLAKGGDPRAMAAELMGKETGICHGKGGSMHVADVSKGILGANGIVGGGVGLAVGAALGAQLDGEGRVAVVFFGDGASSQGVISEALNIAALWKLPLLLVCENNGFSQFSPYETVNAGDIWRRAEPFGMPGALVDGNDVHAVWRVVGEAVARARSGEGATLIEARTYRWRTHVESEESFLAAPYRTQEEVESWKQRDPISRLEEFLVSEDLEKDVAAIRARVEGVTESAITDALNDPLPPVSRAFEDMFANG